MVTLIIVLFFINSSGDLEFKEHVHVPVDSMKECRDKGEEYPIPQGADTMTYLCVVNPQIV